MMKFTTSPRRPDTPTSYPDGVCVKTESGYFLIRQGKRYRLPTTRVYKSWKFPVTIQTTETAVQNYRIVAKLGFRDGSLIHNIGDGRMYLVSNNKRRRIVSPEALNTLQVTREDFTWVSEKEIQLQEQGEDYG